MKNISVINRRTATRCFIAIAAMILVEEYTAVNAQAQTTQFGTRASAPECRDIQSVAAMPALAHVTVPTYLAARYSSGRQRSGTVTFNNLFNGESITMPSWLWDEVKDLNAQLKDRLPASDYLTILKGENRLFAGYKTKREYLQQIAQYGTEEKADGRIGTIQALRKKLGEILANPTSDQVFPRPRFVTTGGQGIVFREYLRHSRGEISLGDESYILTRSRGLQAGYSSLWTFWDSRTGFPHARFACQASTRASSARGKLVGGHPIYYLMATSDELSTDDWCHSSCRLESYLVDPRNKTFQALVPPELSSIFINYVESPAGGLLYRQTNPLPPKGEPYSKSHAPWYAEGDAGKEFLHIPPVKDELDFAWGKANTPPTGSVLFLDSLSQYSRTNEQQEGKATKSAKDKILRLMQPTPRNHADLEMDEVDLGSTQSGYTLFLRYVCHYDEGSDGDGLMVGLLTPNDEILCFPTGGEGNRFPRTGRLRPYSQCIDLRAKVDKDFEDIFKKNNPGEPYVILKLGEERSPNISGAYCFESMAPYIVTSSVNPSEDGKQLELVVGLESWGSVEYDIIRLNLEDYTYTIDKSWSFPRVALNPKWVSNQRIFMKPVSDFQYKIIQAEEGESERVMGDLYVESSNSYAIVLPDGHYAGSPGCESFLQYGDGELGMQALAPWRNRPAEVLEAIGGNADDIAALRETTKRWLHKQGFDPDDMPAEPAVEDFPAVDVQMPALFSAGDTARFTVTARASANDIAKVIVRADGVEIPQSWDSELPVHARAQKELAVEVPLASGQNWIEVTPVDSKGIAGDTFRFRTVYKGSDRSDLYIIALGVSDYDNPDLKLQYAAKDAADISAALEKYGVGNEKHVLLLTDKQVKDRGVLDKVHEFLSAATINDRVVFYVAGHGMLDDRYNYYYAPAGFDPERIAETGITMDELTGCLRDAKARKRLLLLDTCHSGMLGEEGEEKLAVSGVQLPHGVRAVQHRGMKVKKAIGALNTNQKKRYIENLFSRGDIQRGINIIAGAAGAEYALESGEWKNGVFTASVIGAMRGEGAAQDIDGDGFFSVEELQQKVASAVQQQTGGQQKPSIVSAEGAENMVLMEGVGYHKIKQLIAQKDWSQLADVIRKSPRNYNEGQSEELVSEAVAANAPVALIRQMLEHGASPQREYGPALDIFLGSRNPEYLAHRLKIAKLFARSGSINKLERSCYSLRNQGDEELARILCERGVTLFTEPYAPEKSQELFEIFAEHGVDPNSTNDTKFDDLRSFLQGIAKIKCQNKYRNNPAQLQSKLQLLSIAWGIVSPLHDLAFTYCASHTTEQKTDALNKMRILLEHGADPNCMEGHRSDGYTADIPDAVTDVTPLYILCRNGRISFRDALPAIKLLIQHGANIRLSDCNGKEPLDRWDPNYKVLEQLEAAAKSGASMDNIQAVSTAVPNPPAPSYSVSGEDRSDLQPMINRMAALRCREATSALYQKRLLTLLPMIRNGADVNITLPETKGNTALHYSCAIGSWSITQWLVNHGADVNAMTDKGATPLDCVGDDNAARIRALLKSRGAKRAAELRGSSSISPGQTDTDIAAQNGDADAQNNLGLAYQFGKGKPQNYSEAARCFRRAAEQGHAAAQNNLGFCYHNGWGVPQDYSQAAYWYRLSAQQGNAWGESNYGTCLEFGWGVRKDLRAAIEMYRRAALQGHASAKKHLKRHGITL